MAGSELKADLWVNEYITPGTFIVMGFRRILAYKKTAFQEMYIVESGAMEKPWYWMANGNLVREMNLFIMKH
jgi:spermidine synthase